MRYLDDISAAADYMDSLGGRREPFVFLISYDMSQIIVSPESEAKFAYSFNGISGSQHPSSPKTPLEFDSYPLSYDQYLKGYDLIYDALKRGDSYLINLTAKTPVSCSWTLSEVYAATRAPYKVWLPGTFVCFSPETFVTIRDGVISSYPMKGTIDASITDAEEKIMNDTKEFAEHSTMVDLIRNDLSMISKRVTVDRFRYISHVIGHNKSLLQVSSKIDGQLPDDYHKNIGTIISRLLPAGSITGAPKKKTVEVIGQAEMDDRGYYTGICGRFDGSTLDSGVMIRMLSQEGDKMYYHSGGGITYMSDPRDEYDELKKKIYVPIA